MAAQVRLSHKPPKPVERQAFENLDVASWILKEIRPEEVTGFRLLVLHLRLPRSWQCDSNAQEGDYRIAQVAFAPEKILAAYWIFRRIVLRMDFFGSNPSKAVDGELEREGTIVS